MFKSEWPASLGASLAMPTELKTPYITDDANYKFFATQAEAYAYTNAADATARTAAAANAITTYNQAYTHVYVGYYYDGTVPSGLPSLIGDFEN